MLHNHKHQPHIEGKYNNKATKKWWVGLGKTTSALLVPYQFQLIRVVIPVRGDDVAVRGRAGVRRLTVNVKFRTVDRIDLHFFRHDSEKGVFDEDPFREDRSVVQIQKS